MRIKIQKSKLWQEYMELMQLKKELERKQKNIELRIIDKYCPYKKGDKIIYKKKEVKFSRHAIILKIDFNIDGIDDLWEITVTPTNKEFKIYNKKYKVFLVFGDEIKTIIK
jgi:hypothetical protein